MMDPLQRWSKELPTESGYYWWWEIGTENAEIVQVLKSEHSDYLDVWQMGHHYTDHFVVPLELEVFVHGKNYVWVPATDTHPPLLEMWVQP